MSQGLCLLDEALDLARQEMLALEDGAYDRAVELAERRNEVTSMAWHVLESGSTDQYRNRLIELTRLPQTAGVLPTHLNTQEQQGIRHR